MEMETSNLGAASGNGDQDDVDDFLDGEVMDTSPRIDPARELMFSYSVSPGFKHG